MGNADIGLIGLAVMGQNLVLNMNDNGFTVAVYNRTVSKVDEFINGAAKGRATIIGTHSIPEFIRTLKSPATVMLMVKAGSAVDNTINEVLPYLSKGDILIDGGNSHFTDTNRRTAELAQKGILFIGTGVSGGEEGARRGPSIMPGGNAEAWPYVKELFQSISAKTPEGKPCCEWLGPDGAGHFVKMVHNGIEYGDMELIAEAYNLLRNNGLDNDQMHATFAQWNKGDLDSYLIEITADILKYKESDGTYLVDKILDTAGQKGTGKWTVNSSFDLGVPVTLIAEAVFSRALSSLKEERLRASKVLASTSPAAKQTDALAIDDIRDALYASKIVSYAQGFMLLGRASKEYKWNLDMGNIAQLWRGGCIIRSVFLGEITNAFTRNRSLVNLLFDNYFKSAIDRCISGWRRVVSSAVLRGIPVPAFGSALSFYDGYRSEFLPANLLQAQRDYFGAHTYERTDRPSGTFFHTNWTGTGGNTTSGTYDV